MNQPVLNFPPVPPALLVQLEEAVGRERLLTAPAELEAYAWDNTGLRFKPQAVVLVEERLQVSRVLRLCNAAQVAVTPRGAGSGNVGGSLPVAGGVVLSTQRMNRIVEVNPQDRYAVVEPGVVNAVLQQTLKGSGLFWPPDPSSARVCTVGGNLAMCSAGPNAVRYGVTRDWVLGLEAVLPNGETIRTGGLTTKGVVGYDLTRLLIGSEGTLAVITSAILKLAPLPAAKGLARLVFAEVEQATRAVTLLMGSDPPPSAIEFVDPAALELLRRHSALEVSALGRALLMVEVSGGAQELPELLAAALARVEPCAPLEVVHSTDPATAERLWVVRHALSPLLKNLAPRRVNEDVVVPVSRLPELIAKLEELSRESGIPIVNFGHAGNGNIHVNLLVDPAVAGVMARVEGEILPRLFRMVLELGGALSGEHGIGIQKMPFIGMELNSATLEVHRGLKRLFDPQGILNPGKVFPAMTTG